MPRPLANPLQREEERQVAKEIYETLFPGVSIRGMHRVQASFYLKANGKNYKITVKEVKTP